MLLKPLGLGEICYTLKGNKYINTGKAISLLLALNFQTPNPRWEYLLMAITKLNKAISCHIHVHPITKQRGLALKYSYFSAFCLEYWRVTPEVDITDCKCSAGYLYH